MQPDEVLEVLLHLTEAERAELDALLQAATPLWQPIEAASPGEVSPQQMAYDSLADVTGYGGAAGGGKTDLGCGLALTAHRRSAIFRDTGTELKAVIDRIAEIVGSREGLNSIDGIWRLRTPDGMRRQIEFGSFPNPLDETKYQGRPHDLKVFEEAANMRRSAVLFLLGWMRTTEEGQRCRAIMTFNPPTSDDGAWIIDYFAPWLDPMFPEPAQPGELRYAASLPATAEYPNGREIWVKDARKFVLIDGQPCYDFAPGEYAAEDVIEPMSRTFIPSRVTDNPYLVKSGYIKTLQALPEPLRSQMLKGDFSSGRKENPWQVLPTAWVDAAMERWTKKSAPGKMLSLGADIAEGGDDETVIAQRYEGMWFDEPIVYPGRACKDGAMTGGYIVAATRNAAPQHIDLFGVGAKPYGHLKMLHQQVIGVDMGAECYEMDAERTMGFFNVRSMLVWRFREALDPGNQSGIALPPDRELRRQLCAFTWKPEARRGHTCVKVCSRDEIVKKIGRSPDRATAYFLANMTTALALAAGVAAGLPEKDDYDPRGAWKKARD